MVPGGGCKQISDGTAEVVAIGMVDRAVPNILQRVLTLCQGICLFIGVRCEKFLNNFNIEYIQDLHIAKAIPSRSASML